MILLTEIINYHADGRDLEESEGIGHEEEPLGDNRPAIHHEVAEHNALGLVAECPVARNSYTKECGDHDCIANAQPLEHLPCYGWCYCRLHHVENKINPCLMKSSSGLIKFHVIFKISYW